jgi:hypothetical protein
VGDLTPVITGVSQTAFTVATAATGVKFTGMHLGTNCPTLQNLPFTTYSVSTYSCTDGSFYADITPSGTGTGRVTVADGGYGGDSFDAGSGQSGTTQSPSNLISTQPTPTISSIDPPKAMIGSNDVSLTINGTGFGFLATVGLPNGVTLVSQATYPTSIDISVNLGYSATIGYNNVTVTSGGLTSPAATFTVNGPSILKVVSDITTLCGGCSTTIFRKTTYQVENFDGSNAGALPICETGPSAFTNYTCREPQPFTSSTDPCTPTPGLPAPGTVTLNTSGQFIDKWGFTSDAPVPVGCGVTFNDHWYWWQSADVQFLLGSPSGFIETNKISIDNWPTTLQAPTGLAPGTIIPH